MMIKLKQHSCCTVAYLLFNLYAPSPLKKIILSRPRMYIKCHFVAGDKLKTFKKGHGLFFIDVLVGKMMRINMFHSCQLVAMKRTGFTKPCLQSSKSKNQQPSLPNCNKCFPSIFCL